MSTTREERIRRLAFRAGYKCPEDLKAAIKESRKAMRALETKQFLSVRTAQNAASNGAQGDPATPGFGAVVHRQRIGLSRFMQQPAAAL